MQVKEEVMRDGFVKQHLKGLGFDAVIHEFDTPDVIGPHDHPFKFRTFVLNGSYIERVYYPEDYGTNKYGKVHFKDYLRRQGSTHIVEATCVHEIISLPNKKCTTLILPEKWSRQWGFWKFENGEAYFRLPEGDWIKQ